MALYPWRQNLSWELQMLQNFTAFHQKRSSYEILEHHKYEFEHILKLTYEVLTSGI
jgi:hypothetical protein